MRFLSFCTVLSAFLSIQTLGADPNSEKALRNFRHLLGLDRSDSAPVSPSPSTPPAEASISPTESGSIDACFYTLYPQGISFKGLFPLGELAGQLARAQLAGRFVMSAAVGPWKIDVFQSDENPSRYLTRIGHQSVVRATGISVPLLYPFEYVTREQVSILLGVDPLHRLLAFQPWGSEIIMNHIQPQGTNSEFTQAFMESSELQRELKIWESDSMPKMLPDTDVVLLPSANRVTAIRIVRPMPNEQTASVFLRRLDDVKPSREPSEEVARIHVLDSRRFRVTVGDQEKEYALEGDSLRLLSPEEPPIVIPVRRERAVREVQENRIFKAPWTVYEHRTSPGHLRILALGLEGKFENISRWFFMSKKLLFLMDGDGVVYILYPEKVEKRGEPSHILTKFGYLENLEVRERKSLVKSLAEPVLFQAGTDEYLLLPSNNRITAFHLARKYMDFSDSVDLGAREDVAPQLYRTPDPGLLGVRVGKRDFVLKAPSGRISRWKIIDRGLGRPRESPPDQWKKLGIREYRRGL